MQNTPKDIGFLVLGLVISLAGISVFLIDGFKPLLDGTYYISFEGYGELIGLVLVSFGIYFISVYVRILYGYFTKKTKVSDEAK